MNNYDYDVAFSLAGEQKGYVAEVAEILRDNGVRVWFYGFEEVELWGKDQVEYFQQVFAHSAKYCVLFISKEYASKVWPNIERRFIQSRWVKDPDYLLPARFDDSIVIGIPDTVSYISLENRSAQEFSQLLLEKLSVTESKTLQVEARQNSFRVPRATKPFSPIQERKVWIQFILEALAQRCTEVDGLSVIHDDIEGGVHIRVSMNNEAIYSLNIYKKQHSFGDDGISFYGTQGKMSSFGGGINAFGDFSWDKEKESIVLNLHDMSLLQGVGSTQQNYTKNEFIDVLWNLICDIIEEKF